MPSDDSAVAAALAGAFLTGDWTAQGLFDSGGLVLGRRPRWLRRTVVEILRLYPRAPADRPRELATAVAGTDGFRSESAQRSRDRLTTLRWPVAPTRMAAARWPVARLDTLADLGDLLAFTAGQLDWYADTRGRQRRAPAGAPQLYRYRWLTRAGRTPRLLEIPVHRLRQAQRTVLEQIVARVPPHTAAHGFVSGRSARSGAAPHVGRDVVVGLDLRGFFAAVSAARIYGILRTAGYPESVAHTLTGLCTTAAPVRVLSAMPAGGRIEDRFSLRQALAAPHLPQGAPTSPALANLAAYRLDCRLSGLAAVAGATYTRYAVDLTFSSDAPLRPDRFVAAVRPIVVAEGFTLNEAKTRVQSRSGRQRVTGIVVNERTTITRHDYDQLRAMLHNAARTGPTAQNRDAHPDFRAHLLGRIAWVAALDPGRGARLRAEFDRIDWTGRAGPDGRSAM